MNNNELKPRRWLLLVFIVLAIVIVVVLLNKLITNYNERKNSKDVDQPSSLTEDPSKLNDDMINKMQKYIFNFEFENSVGQEYGSSVVQTLDTIIINNKKNKQHLITVVFKDITTSDPVQIKELKKKFDEWTKYEVSVDYDDDGLVNKFIIEE